MITDEMIAEAAAELNEAIINSLPDPHECRHQFSGKFERKMEKLIHRVNHPIRYKVLSSVASIVLVVLIGFTMVMSFSATARAAVIGWIKETFESFHSYYFDTDIEPESNYRYQLDPLPEGYSEIIFSENNGYYLGVYTDGEEMLAFSYTEGPDASVFYIEKEGYLVEEILIHGNSADLYISEDETNSNGIVWCDAESGHMFYISGKFDKDEIINLAKSVKKCPN